jgi:uncharacterized protein (DUF3820 family)
MEYLVFPFGKYKGVALTELPSTYIVFALETFKLPDELHMELRQILLGRLKVFSRFIENLQEHSLEVVLDAFENNIERYESED